MPKVLKELFIHSIIAHEVIMVSTIINFILNFNTCCINIIVLHPNFRVTVNESLIG